MPTFRKREKVLAIILVAVLALNRIQERNLMQALSNRSSAAVTVIGQDRATRKNLNEFIQSENEDNKYPNDAAVPPCPSTSTGLKGYIDSIASSTAKYDKKPDPRETRTKSIPDVDSSTGRIFEGLKFRSFHTISTTTSDDVSSTSTREGLPFSQSFTNKCSKWGVVTTIFDPTLAIKRMASLPSWCLVVVADTKTPVDYMQELKGLQPRQPSASDGTNANYDDDLDNVFFFSVEKQKEWEQVKGPLGSFVKATPWKHFCRKNLGYIFAILHGANFIFDFDDDNFIKEDAVGATVNILPSEDVLENVTVVSQGPSAFNHHPIMNPSINDTSWARGFPLEYIQDATTQGRSAFQKDLPFKSKLDEIGVIQFLADGNPDIDAFHRLSKALPMTFQGDNDAHPVLVPKHSYSPYNAQATIHTKNALWATLLPATVPGRVSDIWRSYFAQCIFADAGLRLVFAPPKISQIRNDHNILGDLSAENDLYLKSGKLIEFLAEWDTDHSSIPGRMEQLWIDLYDRGYVEIEDVKAVQMWLDTLKQIGYTFPPLKRRFRNVAVMGQFNYADSPNLCDHIVFWAQKHREYFDTVVAAGPFSEEQMNVLAQNSIQAIATKTPSKNGFYSPVENLMNTLLRFKNSTKIEAVLYTHDDALLNITKLSQESYPFPTNDIIGNNINMNSHDLSYADVRATDDRVLATTMSYRLWPNGTFADFNKTLFGESIGTLIEGVPNFYNKWDMLHRGLCSGGQIQMAKDPDSSKYQEEDGSLLFPSYTQADFLLVPTKYSEHFAEAARLHLKHGIYLECSLPKIVDIIRQQTSAGVRVVKLCTAWGRWRGKPEMSRRCRPKGEAGIVHPMKISSGLGIFAEEMDGIQF